MTLYKYEESDAIQWVDEPENVGAVRFTFDGKKIFDFWQDYPEKLSPEQVEIFKKENPVLAALKK